MRTLALAASIAMAGCPVSGPSYCDRDDQCTGGLTCARSQECLAAAEIRSLTIRWTVDGQPDTAAQCGALGLTDLTITFFDAAGPLSFAPIPCSGGLFTVDKLPVRFDQVELSTYDRDGRPYAAMNALGPQDEQVVDLEP